jgi:two-component system, NtrC family, sensor kinase
MTETLNEAATDSQKAIAELQRKLAERTAERDELLRQQTATADVLKVISRSAFDLDTVMNTLARSADELCDADLCGLFLKDGDFLVLRGASAVDATVANLLKNARIEINDQSYMGRAMLYGTIANVPDFTKDKASTVRTFQRALGFKAMLIVPMMREGQSIGIFALCRDQVGAFSQRQIDLVQTFADQAVIAIENVRLFDEVQARTKELAASLDELRTAQDRLVQTEKLASLGQLTAGIAHEIKNPLNFVNNFSALSAELVGEMNDVLAGATLDKKTRGELDELAQMLKSNLEKVVQHGKRADSIVKNMLQHSREGSGEHRPADINAIVDESLNLAYHGARAEKAGFSIALQRDLDPSVGMADVYPQEITRVLLNLISNGFYATTKRKAEVGDGFEPLICATTKNLGDKVEICIRDNGAGIPDEIKDKIFNPFFTTKPSGEGTGLGLSMSYNIIVKQHGGSIDAETEPGLFTEFKIVLPRKSQR